ncbi:S16 family serine protease [Amnibacterium setariae]|uniref:Lon proteolytic domain-containing protein n=1 Tax=Amnibacterium setariae TaxID=2306585 RepID=A0A3A1U1E6_9MICO|nr:S16 family serine protease [Amnibacterium setariae]RIX28276.1 hypothetical protein D1781_12535 [Amnibacterium setariae]
MLLLAGCTTAPDPEESKAVTSGSITIHPLFVQGDSGGVGTEVISRRPSADHSFRLEFSEDEVGGLGDSSRAASWGAAITSTLLTGQPLEGRYGFRITGAIDGPSAGALKTVGLLALERGEKLKPKVTMTGTINSTGTIGPVGGIPEKVKGAAEAKYTKVLIPLGQRNSPDEKGAQVDVVREGRQLGVDVVEVGDVYEAYRELTGKRLAVPDADGDPRLDDRSYDKVDAQVTAALGRYRAAVQDYGDVSAAVRSSLDSSGVPKQAKTAADQAADLRKQGLVAGAFVEAQQAAALMETVAAGAELLTPLQTQGLSGLNAIVDRATDTSATEAAFSSYLDSLGTYRPRSTSDVEGLVNAYAGAFDAYSLLDFASARIESAGKRLKSQSGDQLEATLTDFITAVLYLELAKAQIESAKAVFEVGRDNPGGKLATKVDLDQVGDFFRRGADANYAAFTTSGVVSEIADSRGLSTEVVVNGIANADIDVAIAAQQKAVQPALQKYIESGSDNGAYAAMAYGLNNYVRNQLLVEKYYNNAVLDRNFQITDIQFDGALGHATDLARDQLGAEIDGLRGRKAPPVIAVANYEAAGLTQDGSPLERFQALGGYEAGFVTARLLTYLGGWAGAKAS